MFLGRNIAPAQGDGAMLRPKNKKGFSMKNFRCYTLSVEVYAKAEKAVVPNHLRQQLLRAASSIVLNLAEGWGRQSPADRRHFFTIAFGSVRECQAIAQLALCNRGTSQTTLANDLDKLAAYIYRLLHPR